MSVGCGWACGRSSSGSIAEGFIDSSHLLFPFSVIALDVDLFSERVHHPEAMPEARGWRTAEVTSGIALGSNQPRLDQLVVVALGIEVGAGAEARARRAALALSGGTTVTPSTRAKPRCWGRLPGAGGEVGWGCVAGVGRRTSPHSRSSLCEHTCGALRLLCSKRRRWWVHLCAVALLRRLEYATTAIGRVRERSGDIGGARAHCLRPNELILCK